MKKILLVLIINGLFSSAVFAGEVGLSAWGSITQTCSPGVQLLNAQTISSFNTGDGNYYNFLVNGTWRHADHSLTEVIKVAKLSYYLSQKVDLCVSLVDSRILQIQTTQ
ncbi:hypothetical protein D3C76_840730 [compost metagenome]|uniref:hypothetical protein n=1 Tax=Kluyvera intermedia TaxID=61648 RepID=UPI000F9E4E03